MTRARARHLGIAIGTLAPGPLNAITDVSGVRVGHCTVVHDTPAVARTGVTAVLPSGEAYWDTGCFAAVHRFNGFGEVMGAHWIEESGVLTVPVVLTSTHSVGIARDTLLAHPVSSGIHERFHQPVVAETNDGWLSDGASRPVGPHHVLDALGAARSGPVAEGAVGGGTGMIAFDFKAGIGTASRAIHCAGRNYHVGALVQANFGSRAELVVDGRPVGRELGAAFAPLAQRAEDGSIVVVLATDAPLLPVQCRRLAQRAVIGIGRCGGHGANRSGELIICFATGNRHPPRARGVLEGLCMLAHEELNPLFQGAAEATEEAIINSLLAAETMTGHLGRIAHALPLAALARFAGRI